MRLMLLAAAVPLLACVAGSASAAGNEATASAAPPIRPGLWQVTVRHETDGAKTPDPMTRMKELPPEARERMEALLKQRGVDIGSGGVKVCLTRASLDSGQWQGRQSGRCRTEITERSEKSWKFRAVCSGKPASESEGEAVFATPERYTVQTTTRVKAAAGDTKVSHTTLESQWLADDCGDLKPLSPKPIEAQKLPGGK